MRRIAALAHTAAPAALAALAVLLAFSSSLAFPTPAAAGGRTSVLITSQTTDEATALLISTAKYRQLESLLGPPTGKQEHNPKSDRGLWHAAEKPEKLRAPLTDLGVIGMAHVRAGRQPPADAPAISEDSAPRPAAAGPSPGGSGWWWSMPAFAVGMCIGRCGSTLLRRWLIGCGQNGPGPRHHSLE